MSEEYKIFIKTDREGYFKALGWKNIKIKDTNKFCKEVFDFIRNYVKEE